MFKFYVYVTQLHFLHESRITLHVLPLHTKNISPFSLLTPKDLYPCAVFSQKWCIFFFFIKAYFCGTAWATPENVYMTDSSCISRSDLIADHSQVLRESEHLERKQICRWVRRKCEASSSPSLAGAGGGTSRRSRFVPGNWSITCACPHWIGRETTGQSLED